MVDAIDMAASCAFGCVEMYCLNLHRCCQSIYGAWLKFSGFLELFAAYSRHGTETGRKTSGAHSRTLLSIPWPAPSYPNPAEFAKFAEGELARVNRKAQLLSTYGKAIQAHKPASETMHKCTGADVNLVQPGSARAASMQAAQDDPHENAQGGVLNIVIALQEVAHPLRYRQYPLPNRKMRKDMVSQVGRCLDHASCVTRRADRAALAGESDQEIVTAVTLASPTAAAPSQAQARELQRGIRNTILSAILGLRHTF